MRTITSDYEYRDWTMRINKSYKNYSKAVLQRKIAIAIGIVALMWLVGTYIGYVSVIF